MNWDALILNYGKWLRRCSGCFATNPRWESGTYARMPDRKVEAAEKARSAWPTGPCCGGPAGCSASFDVARLRPAPSTGFVSFEAEADMIVPI